MIPKVRVKIYWIPPAKGGRKHPPSGPQYSTVARFEKTAENWPEEAWSIVADSITETDDAFCVIAQLRFLSPNAPSHLLKPGNKFDLFEGHRMVARGEVLKNLQEILDEKSTGAPIQTKELA